MDAAQIAGLNCLRLMNETTAGTQIHSTLHTGQEVPESIIALFGHSRQFNTVL